jgi:hypothetical protein
MRARHMRTRWHNSLSLIQIISKNPPYAPSVACILGRKCSELVVTYHVDTSRRCAWNSFIGINFRILHCILVRTMATELATEITAEGDVTAISASLSDALWPLEFFPIPQARSVHGKSFPLGIRLKAGERFPDVESASRHIESLADKGVFNDLLADRELPQIHDHKELPVEALN